MAFDEPTIKAAQRRQRALHKEKGRGRVTAHGSRKDMVVDPTLYANGLRKGREGGCDNVWNEPEFIKDVKRFHPETVVDNHSSARVGPLMGAVARATHDQIFKGHS